MGKLIPLIQDKIEFIVEFFERLGFIKNNH